MSEPTNDFGQPLGYEVSGWTPPPHPSRHEMRGAYCTVEPLDESAHVSGLFDAFEGTVSDWTYLRYGPFEDVGAFQEWVRATCFGDDPMFYALLDNQSGKPVGMASYLRITPGYGTIELGNIHFGSALKRSRAATEAMFLMMEHVFSLGYRRCEWKCNALNEASRTAALRLGFTFEGTWRQAAITKGRNRDTDWHSIIDAEWPRLQRGFRRWLEPGNFDSSGRQRRRLQDCLQSEAVGDKSTGLG